MKRNHGILITAALLLLLSGAQADNETGAGTLSVMTYNLKFASRTFEPPWEVRREMQVDLIRQYSPDVIGTQEGLKEQVAKKVSAPSDYQIDFTRDKRTGLMQSGIKLTAQPKRMH